VCCALAADAVIGNVQEKALKEFKPSNSEMVSSDHVMMHTVSFSTFVLPVQILFSYSIGALYLIAFDVLFGSLADAFWLWWKVRHRISQSFLTLFVFSIQYNLMCIRSSTRLRVTSV
jgi:hypothetical protein